MAGLAKPCAVCGHNKGQHVVLGVDRMMPCRAPDCSCAHYETTAPNRDEFSGLPAATKSVDGVVDAIERHRRNIEQHPTLDDARKFYALSVIDSILAELHG